MYESTDEMVSHPEHYQSGNELEVIEVIEAFTAGLSGIEACDTGNIIKYACRWSKKNGIQDLEKLIWYAQHLIDHLKDKSRKEHERYVCEYSLSAHEIKRKFITLSLRNKLDEKYKYDVTKIINTSLDCYIINNKLSHEMVISFGEDDESDLADYKVKFYYVNDDEFTVIPLYDYKKEEN